MPYDGIVLSGAVWEINGLLSGGRIEKVFQTGRYEITLLCHSRSDKYRLLISADPEHPRLHLTKSKKENPMIAPPFAMVLRKHIQGGRIAGIVQEGYDRVVTMTVETHNEMGDPVNKKLIVEIMGKYSNIILTSAQGTIFDAIRRVDEEMSSVREVMPGRLYRLPPAQDKTAADDFETFADSSDTATAKAILNTLSGFSPTLCKAVCRSAGVDPQRKTRELAPAERDRLNAALGKCCKQIREREYKAGILEDGKDFHCLEAVLETAGSVRRYSTVNLMLDDFYTKREREDRLRQKRAAVMKHIRAAEEKCRRKIQIHCDTIRETEDYARFKLYGELLTANLYRYPEFAESVTAENYYDETMPQVEIALDPNRSVSQNAQNYFKKYKKQKSGYENAARCEAECQAELAYLESAAVLLENDTDFEDIEEIRRELTQQGYIKPERGGGRPKNRREEAAPASRPQEYGTSDGYTILIGKNNLQNERLTCRTARPDDLWFHLKNAPGSHVILRTSEHAGSVTAHAVECAAALAAWYSSARNTNKADVDYTRVKHVRKQPGGRPGMVNYTNYKTITVRPSAFPEAEQA